MRGARAVVRGVGSALFCVLLAGCGPSAPPGSSTTTTTTPSTSSTTTTIPTPPRTLAIAYTNVDGAPGFSRHHDVMIGELVDADRDAVPSVGDEVVLGRYPRSLDHATAGFGAFQATRFTVESVETATATTIAVLVQNGVRFSFGHTGINETFNETLANDLRLVFVDMFITAFGAAEVVHVSASSIGSPESAVSTFAAPAPADSPHLDVDIGS